jgi:hypothetical protein
MQIFDKEMSLYVVKGEGGGYRGDVQVDLSGQHLKWICHAWQTCRQASSSEVEAALACVDAMLYALHVRLKNDYLIFSKNISFVIYFIALKEMDGFLFFFGQIKDGGEGREGDVQPRR